MSGTYHHRGGRTIRRHLDMHMIGPHRPVLQRGRWNMGAVPDAASFEHTQDEGPIDRALREAALRGATTRLLVELGSEADTSLIVGLSPAERFNFEERDGKIIALSAVDEVKNCLAEGCELDSEMGEDFCAFHEMMQGNPGTSDRNRWREVVPLIEGTDGRRHWDGFAQGSIRGKQFVMPGVIFRSTIIEPAPPGYSSTAGIIAPKRITEFIDRAEAANGTPPAALVKPPELVALQGEWERFVKFTYALLAVSHIQIAASLKSSQRRLDGSYV